MGTTTTARAGACTAAAALVLLPALLLAPGALAQPGTPTPTPSATPPAPGGVFPPRIALSVPRSSAGAPVSVTVTVSPTVTGEVRLLGYGRPSTELRLLRSGTVTEPGGSITWVLRPTSSTRLVAEGVGGTGDPVVLPVAPQLSADLDDELACGTVRGRVLPVAAGRSVRVALDVDGEERVGYRRVDAAGRFVVRYCPPDGLASSVTTVVEVRNGVTWVQEQVAFGAQRLVD